MATLELPSPEALRQLLTYDPESGVFHWKFRNGSCSYTRAFNTRFAGKAAFATRDGNGYFAGQILGITLKAHRVAWAIHFGWWPREMIDHINGVRSDNRISNLRDVTYAQNGKNVGPKRKALNLPTGVSTRPHLKSRPFVARIELNGRPHHLGCFATADDAHKAYLSAAAKNGFSSRHGKSKER